MQKQTAAGVVGVVGGFVLWVLLYKYGPLNFCTVPGEGFGINLHIDVACHPWWKGGFGHLYGGCIRPRPVASDSTWRLVGASLV